MWRAAGLAGAALLLAGAAPGDKVVADLDLSRPFGAPAGWRLVATQGPEIPDPVMDERDPAPALVRLCLRRPDGRCDPALDPATGHDATVDLYNTPHFLKRAAIVFPRGRAAAPLLLVQDGSLFSVDGGQLNVTQLLVWRPQAHGVERVYYRQAGGGNDNEEVRYIDTGPLRGAVIAAEPTANAPYGYWITIHQPTPALAYRQTARFRSSTRYGDGNPLAVIDSEMPNIQRRLGLWHPGRPLPTPAKCAHPHLKAGALWCG